MDKGSSRETAVASTIPRKTSTQHRQCRLIVFGILSESTVEATPPFAMFGLRSAAPPRIA